MGVTSAGAASRFVAATTAAAVVVGAAVAPPLHGAVGIGAPTPLQGSGYEHPTMDTNAPPVSCAFCHPFPALNVVVDPVNVGTASVGTVPVGVYVGRRDAAPALLIVAGGQTRLAVADGLREPAPAPPVCQGARVPLQGLLLLHAPTAVRGSLGIHPCCTPSWYDQNGAWTVPASGSLVPAVEFPILQHTQSHSAPRP